ncbi:hypothetical protein H2198_005654 [Neophaeococcomyces mojaviensis]|uniref:Uncharacterized protein n=1 Tax=Neophaeococcomyces mojaviensis TaxID=3383035 RepID=A0ACC3A4Z6_9EURO|nr:hypothetical protein H2198_005654 [Knufia sp. JES_112]
MGHKRKREAGTLTKSHDDTAEPAPKREKVEHVAAAERRQKRSERKSKKAQQAQGNALQKKLSASDPEFVKADPTAPIDTLNEDFIPLGDVSGAVTETTKTEKKHKKNKKQQAAENGDVANTQPHRSNPSGAKRPSPRSLRKQAKAGKAEAATAEEYSADTEQVGGNNNSSQKPRFICFVGNLPFTCTTDQLQAHFRKLAPSQIRHATDKQTGKSKGFAFLEFDQYDKMKTCLKVYHHSIFDPERTAQLGDEAFDQNGAELRTGQQGKSKGRKINVELTVGGGGGGEKRKEKIKGKNQKLGEERVRRKVAEEKAEKAKQRKQSHGKSEANATPVEVPNGDIHPSRLKRVQH